MLHTGVRRVVSGTVILLCAAASASAEVVRIEVRRRDDFRTYVRLIGRVYFAIDPKSPANGAIVDLDLAPRNAAGLVEFSSDVLFYQPKNPGPAAGTVLFEVVNRGRDQGLGLLSGAIQRDLSPEHWELGDRFALEQGFALAFLGWQFDVAPAQGLTFQTPVAAVSGVVRANFVATGLEPRATAFGINYCAADPTQADATLTVRSRIEQAGQVLPRASWQFGPRGCSVALKGGFTTGGLYEVVYRANGSPIAGLGLAAIRDFASHLKNDGAERVIGFGYSQSARLLREFVRDGFNQDERGRRAFDGLMIASAGAGVGSFNHRFAMPGQAGNSVLSILRLVDVPPFTDDELLARARATETAPKIFYTHSSTEYWARAASLIHTTDDGVRDVPLSATSRLYFLSGTPHAEGPFPPVLSEPRVEGPMPVARYQHDLNFAQQRWILRALLMDLDAWIRSNVDPPASRYPTLARTELASRDAVAFPRVPKFPFPGYMPQVWRMDLTKEPPVLGRPFAVLVPRVNADGNDIGGIAMPEVAVPLGTFTGWNISTPALPDLGYLAGLVGSFQPFAATRKAREKAGDERLSVAERYKNRRDYLERVTRSAQDLVRERFLLPGDIRAVVRRAELMWSAVVDGVQ